MLEIHFLKNEFLAKLLSLLKRENLRTKTEESIKTIFIVIKNRHFNYICHKFYLRQIFFDYYTTIEL